MSPQGKTCLALMLACVSLAAASETVAFRNVQVVHPDKAIMLADHTVLVEDDAITEVGFTGNVAIPDGANVIEGKGRYLVPGLTEMHAHVPGGERGEQYLADVLYLFVANGVTTIRGMLGRPEHLLLKQRIADGELIAPRLFTSGPSMNGNSVDSPSHAAAMVRRQRTAGYDFIKQHPGLSVDEFQALARTAQAVGMPFAGHISRDAGLEATLAAGQATIDHLEGYLAALAPDSERDPGFFGLGVAPDADPERIADLAAKTARAGVAVVPTETLMRNLAGDTTADELAARPEMRYMPADMRRDWRQARESFARNTGADRNAMERFLSLRARLMRELQAAGASILLGSDAPQIFNVPGFSTHRELSAYVDAGLNPAQALASGTTAPADFFGAGSWFGRIEPGLSADLVLVSGNPLENVGHLAEPDGVMVRGKWLDRESIDGRLAEIEDRHRKSGD